MFQADWPQPMPAIGRIANFSSLRKHNPKEYCIYDAYFGKAIILKLLFVSSSFLKASKYGIHWNLLINR